MAKLAGHVLGIVWAALLLAGCQTMPTAQTATIAMARPDQSPAIPASKPMPDGKPEAAPSGFVAFCKRDPAQCEGNSAAVAVGLDSTSWSALTRVNDAWNRAVKPMDDAANYGQVDYWTVPTDGYGDCEDFALGKRQSLMAMGFPASALRLAEVRTAQGVPHAVLDVVTDRGDYVLDNLEERVLPWSATPYVWLSRQSAVPLQWAAVGDHPPALGLMTAAVSLVP